MKQQQGENGLTDEDDTRRRDVLKIVCRSAGKISGEGHAHVTSALRGEGVSQFLTKGREVAWIWY